jgi:hypothetical protein
MSKQQTVVNKDAALREATERAERAEQEVARSFPSCLIPTTRTAASRRRTRSGLPSF